MDDNLPEPSVLLADRSYDSDKVRETMEPRNVVPVFPMRKSRKLRVAVDRTHYRLRNLIELSVCLKNSSYNDMQES